VCVELFIQQVRPRTAVTGVNVLFVATENNRKNNTIHARVPENVTAEVCMYVRRHHGNLV